MYLRNFMLSFVLLSSILLIIDFLLIHHLFGPFGIIISSVMRDLMTFIVVLLLFLVSFTFLICCLFSPITKEDKTSTIPQQNNISNNTLNVGEPLDINATSPFEKNSTEEFTRNFVKRETACRPPFATLDRTKREGEIVKPTPKPRLDSAGRVVFGHSTITYLSNK